MNKSDSIANLAKALASFQAEIENPKNTASNPFFKSKYAPLQDILNLARPLLSKHGLSILQSPSGDGKNIIITTILMHSSGEWIETEPLVLQAEKATAQGAGSAITYGRRYAISAILGISSEDDDDGIHASDTKGKSDNKPPQTVPAKQESKAEHQKQDQPEHFLSTFWRQTKDLGYTQKEVFDFAKQNGVANLSGCTEEQVKALYQQLVDFKLHTESKGA